MWFPTQLLHRADVPLTSNEGSNQFSALAGQITQIPNSVNWPSGFGEMGKSGIKRGSIFSMAVSLAVWRRGRCARCSKQTLSAPRRRRNGSFHTHTRSGGIHFRAPGRLRPSPRRGLFSTLDGNCCLCVTAA